MISGGTVYPSAMNAFKRAQIDLLSDTINAQMVDATYVRDDAHSFLADIASSARVFTPVTLTGKSLSAGWFIATIPPFVAVTAGAVVKGLVIYQYTGSDATSRLLDYKNRRADTVPLSIDTSGADITFSFPLDRIFI